MPKVREVLELLKQDGWFLERVRGSHHIYRHTEKRGSVTIPYNSENQDLPTGTYRSILRQAGLLK